MSIKYSNLIAIVFISIAVSILTACSDNDNTKNKNVTKESTKIVETVKHKDKAEQNEIDKPNDDQSTTPQLPSKHSDYDTKKASSDTKSDQSIQPKDALELTDLNLDTACYENENTITACYENEKEMNKIEEPKFLSPLMIVKEGNLIGSIKIMITKHGTVYPWWISWILNDKCKRYGHKPEIEPANIRIRFNFEKMLAGENSKEPPCYIAGEQPIAYGIFNQNTYEDQFAHIYAQCIKDCRYLVIGGEIFSNFNDHKKPIARFASLYIRQFHKPSSDGYDDSVESQYSYAGYEQIQQITAEIDRQELSRKEWQTLFDGLVNKAKASDKIK